MQKLIYKIVFLGLFFPILPLMAQDNINALDYILQKRPKRDSLPKDRWTDHIFLSGALGGEGVINGIGIQPGRKRIGMNGALYAGKWFNSASALRLGLQVGLPFHQMVLENHPRRYFVNAGITADYMFNLSNYVAGYNPNRVFNFIPFAGAGIHMSLHSPDMKNTSVSARVGFQASFKVSKGIDLFLEPTMRVYTDEYNYQNNWRNFDAVPTIMAGLTYSFVPRTQGRSLIPFDNERLFQHMFFSVGMGASMILKGAYLNKNFYKNLGPELFVGFGNWFTATSGARLSAFGNIYKIGKQYHSLYGGQLDYMLNLNALFEGYEPERLFRIYGIAGMNVAFPEKVVDDKPVAFGFGVGLQGNFRLTSSTDFFIEPRLNYYPNKFAGGVTHARFDMPATVLLGFTYHRPDNKPYNKGEFTDSKIQDHLFMSVAGGVTAPIVGQTRIAGLDALKPLVSMSLGKWFTPRSGLRLQANMGLIGEINSYGRYTKSKFAALDLDYMLDLSNLLQGYNPDRRLSLRAFVGPSALFNSATDKHSPRGFVFGGSGGVQGVVHLSSSCELFIEPKLSLYSDNLYTGYLPPMKGDLLATLTAGFTYNFQSYDLPASQNAFEAAGQNKWFVSLGGGIGTTIRSSSSSWHRGPAIEAAIGKEYSPLSSWRLGIGYSSYPAGSKDAPTLDYMGLEADYMVDLSTLANGYNAQRFFKVKGFAGLSIGKMKYRDDNMFSPGLHVGLQPNFRLTENFSLYLEPRANFYARKSKGEDFQFETSAAVMGGLIWKFNM